LLQKKLPAEFVAIFVTVGKIATNVPGCFGPFLFCFEVFLWLFQAKKAVFHEFPIVRPAMKCKISSTIYEKKDCFWGDRSRCGGRSGYIE